MDEYVAILADILREDGGALNIMELGQRSRAKKTAVAKGKLKVILQRYPDKFALKAVQIKNGQSFMVHLVTRQDHAFDNQALWPMFRSLFTIHRNYAASRVWPNSLNQFISEFEGYTGLDREFAKHEAYNPLVAQGYLKKSNSKLVWNIAKIQDCINQMPTTIKSLKLGASTDTSADALSDARASPFPTSGSMLSLLDGIGGSKSKNKAWKLKVPGSPSEEVRCIYVADVEAMERCILSDLALQASGMDDIQFVAIDCEGVPESLELLQVATEQGVYIFDAKLIGETTVCEALEPLLTSRAYIKLMHDLHKDAVALDKFGSITLCGTLDTQLVGEQVFGEIFLGMNAFLKKLELPQHPSKEFTHARMRSGVDLFAQRPIAKTLLEYSAWDVGLLIRAVTPLQEMLDGKMLNDLVQASDSRAATAMANGGARAIAFDLNDDYRIASADLLRAIRPDDGYFGERLVVESETDDVISLLLEKYRDRLEPSKKRGSELLFGFLPVLPNNSEDEDRSLKNETAQDAISLDRLSDIVLDTGRRPQCWVNEERVFLCDDESELVSEADLNHVANRLGRFGSDNRAGLNGKLHRFSAMRNREGDIAGITIRIGRNVVGNAAMLMDLLMGTDKSILILGEPGSGKSTIIREATRKLAESTNVIVVDTSNEIAGDGNVPHKCIGLARRMMVPSLDKQSDVMVEAVQNHTPNTTVIDEIGRPKEVMVARTVKQRGVRMIASAHGDLRKLLKNKDLRGLVGGVEVVTMGDVMAKEEAKRKEKAAADQNGDKGGVSFSVSKTKAQRSAEPTFEVIIEVRRGARNEWKVTTDSAKAVDAILDGLNYKAQLRNRDPETGHMFLDLIES